MAGYYLLDHRRKPPNWYTSRRQPLRVIVVHITAGLQDLDGADASAEQTARYAATTDRKVSWHSGSDSDSFLHLLPASYTAWHCQGYNSSTFGHEISKATTRWTGMPPAWVDRTLMNTAACLATVVREYGIPLRRLSRAEVDAGQHGFAGHADLDPARRTDPGSDFPWRRLFALIADINNPPQPKGPPLMVIVKNPSGSDQWLTHMGRKWRIRSMPELHAYARVLPRVELDQQAFDRLQETS